MGSAPCASHGPPPHAPALVPRDTDVALRDWPTKTGPARSRIEFLRRRKQSRGAPDAPIDPGLVEIVEPPGVGQLRCPGPRRGEGGRRKALPPRSLVADDLRYSQGRGHCAATIRESDSTGGPRVSNGASTVSVKVGMLHAAAISTTVPVNTRSCHHPRAGTSRPALIPLAGIPILTAPATKSERGSLIMHRPRRRYNEGLRSVHALFAEPV